MKTIIKIGNTYEADFLSEIEGDAPIFIRNCEKIIQNRISHWCPKELFIISLNTTFDSASIEHKESSSDMFSFWSSGDKLEVTRYHPDIYNPSTTIYLSSYKGYEEKTDASYIKKRKREEYSTFKTAYGAKVHNFKPLMMD